MGDINNTLVNGILSHLLTNTLRFVSSIDRDGESTDHGIVLLTLTSAFGPLVTLAQ
ncbi:MAG: hypothetical protein QNK36_18665 [Colwellia sp.]|nr:hypothetical protein [Colwellia sp.]